MSRIHEAFENKKAFIPFITCGDPDLETTKKLVIAMAENGADLIELGIPFSDPTAEGPVIQEADNRALSNGATTAKVMAMAKELRKTVKVPMVFMTYANVVFAYGAEKFLSEAKAAEMDGLILPDVPFEEKEEFAALCQAYDMDLISMIAPTSKQRIRMIAKEAKGFIYVVSSMGVTGVRSQITTDIASLIEEVRSVTDIPCAVGFGISTPETAAKMAKLSDGAIVGSAIVRQIAQYGKDSIEPVASFVKAMSDAVHNS
ncbi:MAG: tryptophan synthase subunit alpha [Erysipelotrichaceae bacterium]|nr:tryptophan synthase subunit alpha [Erysipelotrichaceae bacterium]